MSNNVINFPLEQFAFVQPYFYVMVFWALSLGFSFHCSFIVVLRIIRHFAVRAHVAGDAFVIRSTRRFILYRLLATSRPLFVYYLRIDYHLFDRYFSFQLHIVVRLLQLLSIDLSVMFASSWNSCGNSCGPDK